MWARIYSIGSRLANPGNRTSHGSRPDSTYSEDEGVQRQGDEDRASSGDSVGVFPTNTKVSDDSAYNRSNDRPHLDGRDRQTTSTDGQNNRRTGGKENLSITSTFLDAKPSLVPTSSTGQRKSGSFQGPQKDGKATPGEAKAKSPEQLQAENLQYSQWGRLSLENSPPPKQRSSWEDTRRRSTEARNSLDLRSSFEGSQSASSIRSSFAMERGSFEAGRRGSGAMGEERIIVEMPSSRPPAEEDVDALCLQLNIPDDLKDMFLMLAIVPNDTPLPVSMLSILWSSTPAEALKTASYMARAGIMRVANLYDGSTWALVQPEHLLGVKAVCGASSMAVHAALLDRYTKGGEAASVTDDGYFLQNVGHHLVGAWRLAELKNLLRNPVWLEVKLHSYGVASVVADFRRYLMAGGDEEAKLLLEAFQMSASACLEHPNVAMLYSQMAGRLLAVKHSNILTDQVPVAASLGSKGGPRCLLPKTASLEQAGGLQRMILRGHTGGIRKVLITPGGLDIVTASRDGTCRVWDMEIGDCVLVLEGHTSQINDIAVAADGSILVTASSDKTARVWDLEHGTCLHVLTGTDAAVNSVCLEPQGRLAIGGLSDGVLAVWELSKGHCVQLLKGHGSGSGNDGAVCKVVMTADGQLVVSACEDFTARVWHLGRGKCLHVLQGHSGWVVDAALMADGVRCITASHDGTARVWNMTKGECLFELKGHTGRLNCVKAASMGNKAVTTSDDHTARIWDTATGACLQILKGHGGWISEVALSLSGERGVTVSGDDLAVVWDLLSGKCVNVLEGHSAEICSVVLTRKARFAVTGSEDSTARVWDLQAGSTQAQRSHNGRIHALRVSADGRTALSVGEDGVALVWDCETGACRRALEGHMAALRWGALLADGRHAVTASGDRKISIWNLQTGQERSLPAHQGSRMKSFAPSMDGRTSVVVLFDSTITVWDLEKLECRCMLQKWGDRDHARVHSGGVNAVYVSPDNRHALTVSKDHTARIWDLVRGETRMVLEGHTDGVTAAAYSHDGSLAITASFDNTARLWDLASGTCIGVFDHEASVSAAAFSPDGSLVVTVSDDHMAHIWHLASGIVVATLVGHKDQITDVAFSPNSKHLATTSGDCTLRVWDTSSGGLVAIFMADSGLTSCEYASANTIVLGAESGVVHFLENV